MAIIGSIVGLGNGTTMQNFKAVTTEHGMVGSTLLAAVVASSFAYEGWIVATSINAELKDAKKNLPRALAWGSIIIVVTYVVISTPGLFWGIVSAFEVVSYTLNGNGSYTFTVNESGSVGNYSATTAPIVIPVNTAGYSAQAAPTSVDSTMSASNSSLMNLCGAPFL